MNKDIIYIDVEDDVTSVIDKVKGAKEKIVALVPPKNIGTLQSAVNLRLLVRAADDAGKRIVLISNNSGLKALAAAAQIPVAKNLQSKPELTTAKAAEVDDEEIIDGAAIPIGEFAAAESEEEPITDNDDVITVINNADDTIELTGADAPDIAHDAPVAASAGAGVVAAKKSRMPKKAVTPKIPNFGKFRLILFIGGGLLIALIAFIVIANIFWTSASVVITARTSSVPIDLPVTFTTDGATDASGGIVKAETKTTKKTASVDFTPTGKKDASTRSTGTVTFSTNNISNLGTSIPAGTALTSSGGSVYLTDQSVTITTSNYKGASTGITARDAGASTNGANGSVSGAPNGINATISSSTTGGSDKTITVVSDDDVSAAIAKLAADDGSSAKAELANQFSSDYVVVSESFNAQSGDPTSNPASGSEATTAKVTRDTTYTLTAVPKAQIKLVTSEFLTSQLTSAATQKVYDDGSAKATISQFIQSPSGVITAHIKSTGQTGPNIDETALKTQIVGKKAAEITQQIKMQSGVQDVEVKLSPFWRTTAPSADKIKISFALTNG